MEDDNIIAFHCTKYSVPWIGPRYPCIPYLTLCTLPLINARNSVIVRKGGKGIRIPCLKAVMNGIMVMIKSVATVMINKTLMSKVRKLEQWEELLESRSGHPSMPVWRRWAKRKREWTPL